MYELIQAAPNTWYIDCPAKMGLVRVDGDGFFLIDSGNDKEAGKKALKLLDQNGWKLLAVLNTHSHADHIGGNRLLTERTGCTAYAPGMEAAFTRWPVLEPSFLYGGFPPKALRNKFLMAQPSEVLDLSALPLPPGMEILPLPGHFFDMVGVKTPDGVWFLADCLSGANIVEKYHVNFIYDVGAYLDTLDKVEKLEGSCFIPAHAPACTDIAPLAALNRAKVLEIAAVIRELCRTPAFPDQILKGVFDRYGLTMDFNQYVLVGSTVRSYLSWLLDRGEVSARFEGNTLLWQACSDEAER